MYELKKVFFKFIRILSSFLAKPVNLQGAHVVKPVFDRLFSNFSFRVIVEITKQWCSFYMYVTSL